jgi:hypothetical protein
MRKPRKILVMKGFELLKLLQLVYHEEKNCLAKGYFV